MRVPGRRRWGRREWRGRGAERPCAAVHYVLRYTVRVPTGIVNFMLRGGGENASYVVSSRYTWGCTWGLRVREGAIQIRTFQRSSGDPNRRL